MFPLGAAVRFRPVFKENKSYKGYNMYFGGNEM